MYQLVFHMSCTVNDRVRVCDRGWRWPVCNVCRWDINRQRSDFIIIDDPIKPEDTHSDKVRQSTNEWYKSTLLSRLDDKKRSVLVLVMQRLHVNDLTGFVESSGVSINFRCLIAIMNEYIPIRGARRIFALKVSPYIVNGTGWRRLRESGMNGAHILPPNTSSVLNLRKDTN